MRNKNISFSRFGIDIKKEKNCRLLFLAIILLVSIVILIIFSFAIQYLLRKNLINFSVKGELNATWFGSVASYWGGVIGGIISGVFTVISVWLTIQYYRKSDESKKRIEHMPFLALNILSYNELEKQDVKNNNCYRVYKSLNASNNDSVNDNMIKVDFEIENVGRDFASTLVINTFENFGGIAFNKLIKAGSKETLSILFKKDDFTNGSVNSEVVFYLQYIDCMTNEYSQKYVLNADDYSLENGYPYYMGTTHHIGN